MLCRKNDINGYINLWFFLFQDLARNARETKMHYSPSEKDGVFVVEVARGADSNHSCNGKLNHDKLNHNHVNHNYENNDYPNSNSKKISRDDETLLNNEDVQVHAPPFQTDGTSDDELLTVDEDGAVSMSSQKFNGDDSMRPICGSSNTGLSQSDLSISSSCGSNQGYTYGTQQAYTVDSKGYQSSSPHYTNDVQPLIPSPQNNSSKPIITAAIYKQDSIDPSSSYPEDGRAGKLRTDKNAMLPENSPKSPISVKEESNDISKESKPIVEEQRIVGNGVLASIAEGPVENCLSTPEKVALETVETGFDSLINLPAPPSVDEIKQLSELTLSENNNMDSLPPPPPPELIVDGLPINAES